MLAYILRRLLLIVPTLLGIMLVSFVIIQFAPGGPVERMIAQLTGNESGATDRFSGGGGDLSGQGQQLGQDEPARNIAARRVSIRSSSRASSANTASTSRPANASSR